MPTYEYECVNTGKRFERFQHLSAAPLKACPACGGPAKRLIGTGAAVIVKGRSGAGGAGSARRPSCGRDQPCCGRDTVCDARPCDD